MMNEVDIEILINRKPDIKLIEQAIISNKIQIPVFIIEYESHYRIEFTSYYEEWELDSSILKCFPDYEFIDNLEKGRKEIRLQISRCQSPFSTDNWGRPIEDPVNEIKYLIKKSTSKPERFNPKVKVLFEDENKYYFVNIIDGINKTSGEKGYLLINDFKTKYTGGETEVLKDRLYKSLEEAFSFGCKKVKGQSDSDFKEYLDHKKKELGKQQKLPREIIREFINSCNKLDVEGIVKNLADDVIFEKVVNWQRQLKIEGLDELKKYIKSPNQELCSREIKIRSSWTFDSLGVTIEIKYYPVLSNVEKKDNIKEQRGRIVFVFKGDKITSITENKYGT